MSPKRQEEEGSGLLAANHVRSSPSASISASALAVALALALAVASALIVRSGTLPLWVAKSQVIICRCLWSISQPIISY